MTLTTWRDFAGDTGKAVTTWNYDRFRGWLLTKRDAANTGPTYAYWPSGRLKQRTWARQAAGQPLTTAYSYNAAGDLVLTDYSDATPDVNLSYDRRGRSVTTTDASGTRTFGYHLAGAVQSETYGNSGPLAGQSVSRTFDGLYRLGSLSSTGLPASVAYAYDAASRLRELSQATQTATYTYTPNTGQIASITSSANGVTRLTSTKNYDQRGRLASVSHTIGSTALGHSYGYNSADQRTRATREDGSYWDYAYDTLGQISNAVKRRADGVARLGQTFAYTYDDIGNRRSATLNSQTATYTADVLNRYVTRTVPSVVPVLGRAAADATVLVNREATTRQDGWFYTEVAATNTTAPQYVKLDVSGIKPPAGTGPEIAAFEQRKAFLAQTPETFAYDADGNLTQDGRWTYAWDAENRLVAMEARSEVATLSPALRLRLEFAYDGSGRRIRKQVKTWNDSTWTTTTDRRFLYDGWNLIAEFDANATNSTLALARSYTWGLDLSGSMQGAVGVGGLLWTTSASPATTHAFLADGNGNVIASVDAATGLVSHADDFSPFGETIPLAGSRPGAFGFSSKYTDAETGLLYYGYRYYNPKTGRWLSRDPMEEEGGINLYLACNNSMVNQVDPDGQIPLDTIWDIGNIIYDIAIGDYVSLTADVAALAVPYVPAGSTKFLKVAKAADVAYICPSAKTLKVEYKYLTTAAHNFRHTLSASAAKTDWVYRTVGKASKFRPGWGDAEIKPLIEQALAAAKSQGKIKPSDLRGFVYDTGQKVGASNGKVTTKIELKINDNGEGLHAFPKD